jgi:hypothetical protein
MPLLAQQELIEVAPERHVVVPSALRDVVGWWGIDVSTRRYNVGYVTQSMDRGVHSVRLGEANDNVGERLTRFARQLRLLLQTMLGEGIAPPAVVFVEHPAGKNVEPVLWYAVGTATQVAYETIADSYGYVPRVETIPPSSWKLKAVGRGNLPKPKRERGKPRPELDAYPVWRWARTLGLAENASWDDADAYGIAEAARRTIGIAP